MAADDRMTDDAITDLEGFHIRATAATSPAASDPGICGNGGRRAYFPARKATSDICFTVAARTWKLVNDDRLHCRHYQCSRMI